jgi:hypothetical protein
MMLYDQPSELPDTLDVPTFLFLHLNKHIFEGSEEDQNILTVIIQLYIDNSEISIVLVHEKDIAKGGCDFGVFFSKHQKI